MEEFNLKYEHGKKNANIKDPSRWNLIKAQGKKWHFKMQVLSFIKKNQLLCKENLIKSYEKLHR